MNRNLTKNNFRSASLRRTGSARTVLLRMAADQERADRIRALKQERPDLTWKRIADHVGVTERAAADWQRKGGIEYDNAVKLAEIFDVDTDYVWRGDTPAGATPSPFPDDNGDSAKVAELLERVEALLLEQNSLLSRQSEILERIEAATARADETSEKLAAAVAQSETELRSARAPRPVAKRKTAPKRNRAA